MKININQVLDSVPELRQRFQDNPSFHAVCLRLHYTEVSEHDLLGVISDLCGQVAGLQAERAKLMRLPAQERILG